MLKSLSLFAAALFLGTFAMGQDAPPAPPSTPPQRHAMREDWAQRRLQRMSKRLNLTDDQKEKLLPMLQDQQKQLQALNGDTSLTPQQRHRKERDIQRGARAQMDGVLTDDQKKLMQDQKSDRHARRKMAPPPTDNSNPQ